jgi:hypothetical protein
LLPTAYFTAAAIEAVISASAAARSDQPVTFTHLPFSIFVGLEEMLDGLARDRRQLGDFGDVAKLGMDLVVRDADDFRIAPGFVLHVEHADRAHSDHRPCRDRLRHQHQHIGRITVFGQRARDEAVGRGIGHRGEQEAVDHEGAGVLVNLVFHGRAGRDLDHHIDIVRRVLAGGDFRYVHAPGPCRHIFRRFA